MENDEKNVDLSTDTSNNEEISQVNNGNPSTETDNPSGNIDDANNDETKNDGDENLETYTKDQVNELIRKRLERQKSSLFKRYGISDKKGLDELVTKAHSYDAMKEQNDEVNAINSELSEKLAFIENNINPARYDDIRAYFKGKGIEFNTNSLKQELETHPEWVNATENLAPKTTFQALGVEHNNHKNEETEEDRMKRVFGI